MPRYCFVSGCKSRYIPTRFRKPGQKRMLFFQAPKDPVLRKLWQINSGRLHPELTRNHFFCEFHFTEDCIERYFTSELYDGERFVLERTRMKLRRGSVPTIFPFSEVKKRGRPKKENAHKFKKMREIQNKENARKKSLLFKLPRQVLMCSADGCTNSSDKKVPGIAFHRFPINDRRKAWIEAVGRTDWQPMRKSVLCSAHFAPDQLEHTRTSVKLKPGAIPTIFSSGNKDQTDSVPVNLQTDSCDSSHSDGNESGYSAGDIPAQDSDDSCSSPEEEVPHTETVYFIQEEDDNEPSEKTPSSEDNIFSDCGISENLIAEGCEEVFGKFVANELKILSCDPYLYSRTKEKIWKVLEEASANMLK